MTFFCSVFTQENENKLPDFEDRVFQEVLSDIDFTPAAVLKKLKKLKPDKSPGPDGHHPYVLKELAGSLAEPLSIVFKKING